MLLQPGQTAGNDMKKRYEEKSWIGQMFEEVGHKKGDRIDGMYSRSQKDISLSMYRKERPETPRVIQKGQRQHISQ